MMISVIIPMYNSKNTIIRALDSVKKQTLRCEYEVLVINDGSKDDSQSIVEQYIQENPDFNVILINQENGGVSKARNTGLRLAKGDFIAFLDSDDYWLINKIEEQVPLFEEDGVDFVCCLRNKDSVKFPYYLDNGKATITTKKLLLRVVGQTSTAIFKKKILLNTGYFDENQKYSEDANFWLRISLNNKMIILNKVLVKTDNDYGQLGLSSNLKEMEKGVHKNLKEMLDKKVINILEYLALKAFYVCKYLRRVYL